MRQKVIWIAFAASGLALVGLALRQCSTSKTSLPPSGGIELPKSPAVAEQPIAQAIGQKPSMRLPRPQTPEDVLKRHNVGASGFDTQVQFWGKVLDQDGQPVEGVSITASVTTLRMIKTENGYREFDLLDTQSKADGSFMIDGAAGFSLTIEKLTKPGYVLPSPYQEAMRFPEDFKYRYAYAPMAGDGKIFHPNPASPVIYRLWKLKNPEPMTMWGSWAGYKGSEYELDGEAKKQTMATMLNPYEHGYGPDITIAVTSVGTEQSPQWEVTVAAVEEDGGVAKADSNDPFMFEAPEGGYERVQKFRYGPEDTEHYGEGAPVRFFVRSKQRRWYSAADLVFYAPDASGKIVTKSRTWLNPNGSRNLEHDAANPIDFQGL